METQTKTQNSKVFAYLMDGKRLTAREAEQMWGIMRLAARVNDLKKEGWLIETKMITVKNRDLFNCRVAQYRITHTKDQKELF